MPNLPIFHGTIPPGERGDGCLVPTTPTPVGETFDVRRGAVPRLSEDDWLTDREIDERCQAFRQIITYRLSKLRPIQVFQGQQGSCTASATGNGLSFCNLAEHEKTERPSQATIYRYDGVDRHGNLIPRRSDNGMALISAIRIANIVGIAPATVVPPLDWRGRDWPGDWPEHASPNRLLEWKRLDDVQAIKTAIARPVPVLHGYRGHARLPVWRDPDTGGWWCVNSWESEPIHKLTDRMIAEGEEQYECFGLFSTVARQAMTET